MGVQTLDILRMYPDQYEVVALGARRSVEALAAQARFFRPRFVALADSAAAGELTELLPADVEVMVGDASLADAAASADIVVNAVVGFAGLPVTMSALRAGKRLGLANKESLIAAGSLVRKAKSTPGAEIIPIDSEHCAVHQCLHHRNQAAYIVLTASGGPFRGYTHERLRAVTAADALAHPTWHMGPKISIDSSTLMNKGLEVIEAHELFNVDYDRIDIVVHPQSVVHSMVTFSDGATIAQLSMPDMRLCIGYALAYPDRLDTAFGAIDWAELHRLDFEQPDRKKFACIDLAYAAGRAGETAPTWLNAANEVAAQAFIDGKIEWIDIAGLVADTMSLWPGDSVVDMESVLEADAAARRTASRIVNLR